MRKIVIGFSKPKGFFKPFSWMIRIFNRTPYSHVYCSHVSEKYKQSLIYQASGVQVNFMSLQQFIKHSHIVAEFEFEVSEEAFNNYMSWAIQESGAPYSTVKLFEILTRRDLVSDDSQWVCSTLVAKICKDYLSHEDESLSMDYATPKEIYEFCVFKGRRVL